MRALRTPARRPAFRRVEHQVAIDGHELPHHEVQAGQKEVLKRLYSHDGGMP
jgi:hypothetical protein